MQPTIDLIKASDGSGNASVATVQNARSPLATTLQVDTVQGIPTTFIATMGTPHTFTDPITGETITVISEATAVDFFGHVDGTDLEIDAISPGYTDAGSEVGDIVIIRPTTSWADNIAALLEVALENNGVLKDNGGWIDVEDTWTYSAWDSALKRGTITVPTDATTKYSRGMFVRFTQATGGQKWGFIHAVTTTTLVVFMGASTLNNEAITAPDYSYQATPVGIPTAVKDYNPYKFHAYRTAAQVGNGGATTKMPFETELYDTNANYDNATNYRYTAPVTGYYHFDWKAPVVSSNGYNLTDLYKNGVAYKRGSQLLTTGGSIGGNGSVDIPVTAADYFEVYYRSDGSGASNWELLAAAPFFNAHLISEG